MTEPTDATPLGRVQKGGFIFSFSDAVDDDIKERATRLADSFTAAMSEMAELMSELTSERTRRREMFARAEQAENALYDAQRGRRERLSDWWAERVGR